MIIMHPDNATIVVIGSSNTDMVVRSRRLPGPGETVLGQDFFMNPGGKGGNQAVAAARLGGKVTLIAKTGRDIFGVQALENFRKEGINTSFMSVDPEQPSGVALITVDDLAENAIVVAPGANGTLNPADLEPAGSLIRQAAVVLLQLEIPLETVAFAASMVSGSKARLVLNPAPARPLPDSLLRKVGIITPNESEASLLTGMPVRDRQSAAAAAAILQAKGVETVIITMGARGALLLDNGQPEFIPAPAVKAVDSTAAGDVFNGALAVALAEGHDLSSAVAFSCRVASLSVTRTGAQASAPYRHELNLS